MKFKFVDQKISYDGTQLKSLYNYLQHDLMGNSVVSFIGPCDVSLEHMVDGEDLKENSKISSDLMLHFIAEIFHQNLFSAVCLQRLLADLVISSIGDKDLFREGDDIYKEINAQKKKLSISIATSSPVSQLIHFAVNITNKGTPVPTLSLEDLKKDPKALALKVGAAFAAEYIDIVAATTKVHWVK